MVFVTAGTARGIGPRRIRPAMTRHWPGKHTVSTRQALGSDPAAAPHRFDLRAVIGATPAKGKVVALKVRLCYVPPMARAADSLIPSRKPPATRPVGRIGTRND